MGLKRGVDIKGHSDHTLKGVEGRQSLDHVTASARGRDLKSFVYKSCQSRHVLSVIIVSTIFENYPYYIENYVGSHFNAAGQRLVFILIKQN